MSAPGAATPPAYRGQATPGEAGGVAVTRPDGTALDPGPSLAVRSHSPTGFAWGYGGSGPAQLALALLLDRTGDPGRAARHYQAFKRDMVARWPWDAPGSLAVAWLLPVAAVDAWLEGRA